MLNVVVEGIRHDMSTYLRSSSLSTTSHGQIQTIKQTDNCIIFLKYLSNIPKYKHNQSGAAWPYQSCLNGTVMTWKCLSDNSLH